MSKDPKISLIMPLKNAAKTLKESIYSCLNQSLKQIELIIIDDNSADESPFFLKEISVLDPRVILIKNEKNLGVFQSRALGLLKARADLIIFVDADDFLHEDACKLALDMAFKFKDVDLFYFESYIKRLNLKLFYKIKHEKIYQRDEFLEYLSKTKHFYESVWAKLFKRDIALKTLSLLDIKEKLSYGEDSLFVYAYMLCSKKIFLSKKVLYTYNFSENGLFNTNDKILLKEHIKNKSLVLKNLIKLYKSHKTNFSKLLLFVQKNELKDLKFRLKKIENKLNFMQIFFLRLRKRRKKKILKRYKNL